MVMVAFPLASLLYHWAWYSQELHAARALLARGAAGVPSLRPAPRRAPTKAETKATLAQRARERYWARRLGKKVP